MNSPHLISKVFFTSVLLPAHITVSKSCFMNCNFMISKVLLDIILLTGHSTLSESSFMNSPYQARIQRPKKGGSENQKIA